MASIMGLDFFQKDSNGKDLLLLSVPDSALSLLEIPINGLHKKTGIYIDPFGTTVLYFDHTKLLISLISDYESTLNFREKKKFEELTKELKSVLKTAVDTRTSLFVEGD